MVSKCGEHEPRESEKIGVDALAHFLEIQKKRGEVVICPEPNDPPDFWMTIAGEQYAVEVTSIMKDRDYLKRRIKLINVIEKQCREANLPSGAYRLVFRKRPKIPGEKSNGWGKLVKNAVEMIRNGIDELYPYRSPILKDDGGYAFIEKSSSKPGKFHLNPGTDAKWEGESKPELLCLFRHAVDNKIKKIENNDVPKKCAHIILVLCDEYIYLGQDDAMKLFKYSDNYRYFHSVFWVASCKSRENTLYP